jgi:large subunit ribosomal protein L9
MQVILLERIEKLGNMGDVVNVKPGFARNYLLPQKKALRASKDNLAYFEEQRAQLEADNQERMGDAEKIAKQLDGMTLVVIRQAGDSGQLYGSVSGRDVTTELRNQDIPIEKGMVAIDQPIKEIGVHPVRIALHPEVSVTIQVNVARSDEEAEVQLERHKAGEEIVAEEIAEEATAPVDEGTEEAPEVEAVFEEGAAPEAEEIDAEAAAEEIVAAAEGEDAETPAEETAGDADRDSGDGDENKD